MNREERRQKMTHELKILSEYFWAVKSGAKNFEIRKNDRDFRVGDTLILKEWKDGEYTGEELERDVGYIYHGDGTYGLADGYCVMALKRGKPCVLDFFPAEGKETEDVH